MKLTYTLAAFAATALAANAATTFHDLADSSNNQAVYGDVAGFSFTVGTLGTDTTLGTIALGGRSTTDGTTTTDLVQFEVFAVSDANTWDLSTSLGLSDQTQALSINTVHNFTFNIADITLTDNTSYLVVVHNRTLATNSVAWGLVDGNTDAGTRNFQNDGGDAFSGSHEAALTVTAVPEPSSAALLGLGGLALILRRRK